MKLNNYNLRPRFQKSVPLLRLKDFDITCCYIDEYLNYNIDDEINKLCSEKTKVRKMIIILKYLFSMIFWPELN